MQFRVVIPPQVVAGQRIRVRCPDGTEGDVQVPKGLKAGDSFLLDMKKTRAAATAAAATQPQHRTFWEREVISWNDLLVALGLGLWIGVSIVTGFLMGVLLVTAGDAENGEAGQQQTPVLRQFAAESSEL